MDAKPCKFIRRLIRMKKLLALAAASAMLLGLLAGCSSGSSSSGGTSSGGSASSSQPAGSGSVSEPSGSGSTSTPAGAGSVYYLNFKPEADEALQDLAKTYTEQTGVPVKVLTAASGTYSDTLTSEMAKTEPPTIFNIGNAAGMADWGDKALDLTGAKFFDERVNDDYVLYDADGTPKALGYCYESFGIIVNTKLLGDAGYSLEDISSFEGLKAAADDIHARAGELGFDAFSSPGLESSSSWRYSGHLLNVPLYYQYRDAGLTVGAQPETITSDYLDNYRSIWDLYITDTAANATSLSTATGDESEAEFGEGKAVFYQNGDWEFANLTAADKFAMSPDDLAMIPIYCGVEGEENAGLNSGTENCWAINADASEENIQASEDFLYWLVTSDEGTTMLSEQFSGIPFKSAKPSANVFGANAAEYANAGKYTMFWAFNDTPNVDSYRSTVVTALTAYSADPTDANWDKVVEAVVDGWSIEWNAVNG